MRTNIDIPEELLAEAQVAFEADSKRSAVIRALEEGVRRYRQRKAVEESAGIGWDGDLDAMRDADRGPA